VCCCKSASQAFVVCGPAVVAFRSAAFSVFFIIIIVGTVCMLAVNARSIQILLRQTGMYWNDFTAASLSKP